MKKNHTKTYSENAIIKDIKISTEHGVLTAWCFVRFGSQGEVEQGFGGHFLGNTNPDEACLHPNYAGAFVTMLLAACDVQEMSECIGKAVRIYRNTERRSDRIIGIGHIYRDPCFIWSEIVSERTKK